MEYVSTSPYNKGNIELQKYMKKETTTLKCLKKIKWMKCLK